MKNKIVSLIFSVVLAFALWAYVVTVVSPEDENTFPNIPVVFESETALNERNLMLTSGSNSTVTLRISGARSDLSKLNSSNITVKVDLAKVYDPGEHKLNYSISYPGDVSPSAFTVETRLPSSVSITVERRASKRVPVEVVYSGAVHPDYICDTENAVLDITGVAISGPSSVVDQIATARIEVDLEGRTESVGESYRYTLCDLAGEPVDAAEVEATTAEIRLDLRIQQVKEVPLVYTLIEGGGATQDNVKISCSSETIRVCGSSAMLAELESIDLGIINLAEISSSTQLTFPIELPDGVTNLTGVTEVTVDITLTGLTTQEFTVENIQAINVPEGMRYEVLTQVLKVTMRGPTAQINALTDEDIIAVVDFSEREVGSFTAKADISVINENCEDVGAMGTYSVSVILSAEDEN